MNLEWLIKVTISEILSGRTNDSWDDINSHKQPKTADELRLGNDLSWVNDVTRRTS